jgi:hypothetical protein
LPGGFMSVRVPGLRAALAAICVLAAAPAPAPAQSLDATKAIVAAELGDPEAGLTPQHLLERLPGRWLAFYSAEHVAGLTEEMIADRCQGLSVEIAPDFSATLHYSGRNGTGDIAGRLTHLNGFLFSLAYDEETYLKNFLGLTEERMKGGMADTARMAMNHVFALTPRGADLLVGVDVLGLGRGFAWLRCPA